MGYINDTREKKGITMSDSKKSCPKCAEARHTLRGAEDKKKMINRLSRIEGQIRGLKGMVEEDAYCPDIMLQVSAVTAALNSFNRCLMENHLKNCVTEDLKADRVDTMDELIEVLQKLMR